MRKMTLIVASSCLVLTACASVRDSRINPFNWFGRAQSETLVETQETTNPLIPRRSGLFARARAEQDVYQGRAFEQVTDLKIDRTPSGAIIRATGLAARQGIYEVQLTPANDDEIPVDGVLTYRLEGVRPERNTPIGSPPTREVTAARWLTTNQLQGVRSIRVEGLLNAQVVRR
ncbi:MAG: hypothetical protein AAF755_07060 [Pseudomonadota bacterium]